MIQEALDQPALTTDVIVGFPGETDNEFESTCRAAKEIGFSKIHIFPFSPRSGTPAADMPDQIPKRVKSQRSRHLGEIESRLRQKYFKSLLGRRLQLLVESVDANGTALGTACRYAPFELESNAPPAIGTLFDVTASELRDRGLRASI